MSMALKKKIPLGDIQVEVRELTVGEIRQLLKLMAEESDTDIVEYALLDEIGLRELQMMTDLEKEFVDDLAPSQLRQVYEACRDMNPDFFALRGRLEERGRAILARLSGSLNETQAP